MRFDVLQALRDRVRGDADLDAYCQARYGRAPSHWIGLRKPRGAQDCPSICYVPAWEEHHGGDRVQGVSLVVAVNQPAETDGEFAGVGESAAISELVAAALYRTWPLAANMTLDADFESLTDLGARHPFYMVELMVRVVISGLDVPETWPAGDFLRFHGDLDAPLSSDVYVRAEAALTIAGGVITGVTVKEGGAGYIQAPEILLYGPGAGAVLTAAIAGGSVTDITVTDGGAGYTGETQMAIAYPPGGQIDAQDDVNLPGP